MQVFAAAFLTKFIGVKVAKRFADTQIVTKKWYRDLSSKMKSVWWQLLLGCDHAGLAEADAEYLSFLLGEEITIDEIITEFSGKIAYLASKEKLVIVDFVSFQYGDLNEKNNAHKSVIGILRKNGILDEEKLKIKLAPQVAPNLGAQDKDKDKDKDKEKDKEKESSKKPAPSPKAKKLKFDFEALYKNYPIKKGKSKGIEKCVKVIKTEQDYQDLKKAIENYAADQIDNDPKYIKHFSNFMSVWKDFIDFEVAEDPTAAFVREFNNAIANDKSVGLEAHPMFNGGE